MKVRLLAITPDSERLIAASARLCYSARSVAELLTDLSDDEVKRLVRMLRDSGHLSPFEHVACTFSVEGLSRAALAQFTRHRLASFSVRSQRHVRSGDEDLIVPPSIQGNEEASKRFFELKDKIATAYDELLKLGIAKEDARFCLPQASPTSLIVTVNARELLWIARLRICRTSQWEIRKMVRHMVRLVRPLMPTVMEQAGPPCRAESCPEHKGPCKLGIRLKRWRKHVKGSITTESASD